MEDGLGLTAVAGLLAVVSSLTLCGGGGLTGLLLPRDGVRLVGVAALAVSVLLLRVVNLTNAETRNRERRVDELPIGLTRVTHCWGRINTKCGAASSANDKERINESRQAARQLCHGTDENDVADVDQCGWTSSCQWMRLPRGYCANLPMQRAHTIIPELATTQQRYTSMSMINQAGIRVIGDAGGGRYRRRHDRWMDCLGEADGKCGSDRRVTR